MRRSLLLYATILVLVLVQEGQAIKTTNVFVRAGGTTKQNKSEKAAKEQNKGKYQGDPTAAPSLAPSSLPIVTFPPSCGGGMECDDPAPEVSDEIDKPARGELSLFGNGGDLDEFEEEIVETATAFEDITQLNNAELNQESSRASSVWHLPLICNFLLAFAVPLVIEEFIQ